MNLMSLTAVELGKKIKSGEVTAVDATKAALEQIKKLDLLKQLPDYFAQIIDFEREKASHGMFLNGESLDQILAQCNAMLTVDEHHFLITSFSDRLRDCSFVSDSHRTAYEIRNRQIINDCVVPAYQSLITSLGQNPLQPMLPWHVLRSRQTRMRCMVDRQYRTLIMPWQKVWHVRSVKNIMMQFSGISGWNMTVKIYWVNRSATH